MQKYGQPVITTDGMQMLNEIDGGKGKITYTNAIACTQDISSLSTDQLKALTALTGQVLTTSIKVTDVQDTSVTISTSFNNESVSSDIVFNSIGFMAKTTIDNTEKLFAVLPSDKQTLVAGSDGGSTSTSTINLTFQKSQSAQITITPSSAGSVNQSEMETAIDQATDKIRSQIQALDDSNPTSADSTTDASSLTHTGSYSFTNPTSQTGLPTTDSGTLAVKSYGGTVIQTYISSSTHDVYTRTLTTGSDGNKAWDNWQQLANKQDLSKAGKVKTVSVDDDKPVGPDDNGNINLPLDLKTIKSKLSDLSNIPVNPTTDLDKAPQGLSIYDASSDVQADPNNHFAANNKMLMIRAGQFEIMIGNFNVSYRYTIPGDWIYLLSQKDATIFASRGMLHSVTQQISVLNQISMSQSSQISEMQQDIANLKDSLPKTITQAEYDALSDDDKKKRIYLISG